MNKILVDREFLVKLKEYIEEMESFSDGQLGKCRSSKQLIADGEMPVEYYTIVKLLMGLEA